MKFLSQMNDYQMFEEECGVPLLEMKICLLWKC
jgi:hypothetical protein